MELSDAIKRPATADPESHGGREGARRGATSEAAPQPSAAPAAPRPASAEMPLELLRTQPYFAGMSEESLRAIAALMRPTVYRAGDVIFAQGSKPDGLYVLEGGSVLFWTRIGDTRKEIITFEGGNTLCSSALVESDGRLASAEALAECRVWVLDTKAFQGMRTRGHEAAFRLLRTGAENLSTAYIGSLLFFRNQLGLLSVESAPATPLDAGASPTEAHDPLLKVVPFLRGWSAPDLARLRALGTWRELKRGSRLAVEGEPAGELHLVVRGAVEASANCTGGKMRFALRGPGRWCGHEAFFSGLNQPFDLLVRENAALLSIGRDSLEAAYEQRDLLTLDVLEQITDTLSRQFNVDHRELVKRMLELGHVEATAVKDMKGFFREVGLEDAAGAPTRRPR